MSNVRAPFPSVLGGVLVRGAVSLDAEISIDCFAGGGGASTGMAAALGRAPAIAINHWGAALQVHAANHRDHHSLVAAFLTKFYGTSAGAGSRRSAPAGGEHLGLVTVRIEGELYSIADIGMRMLTPAELFAAQGFPSDYQFRTGADGVPLTKTAQVRLAGNSVCPPVAEALVRANALPARISRAVQQAFTFQEDDR